MSNQYCTSYGCERPMVARQNGKPYCGPCINQYLRGMAHANDIIKEISVLRNAVTRLGLGGNDE